jgi:hypothetical protein
MAGTSPAMTSLSRGTFCETRSKSHRTWPPHRSDFIAFVAAKSLAKLDFSLRHGGCGKQSLG